MYGDPIVPAHTGNVEAAEDAGTPQAARSPSKYNTEETAAAEEESKMGDTIFAKIAIHSYFQNTTLFIIVLNAVWIFVDVQWNHTNLADETTGKLPLQPASDVIEQIFCVYFTGEVLIRFLGFRRILYCLTDGWFVFDSVLVLMMVLETWILPIISLVAGSDGSGGALSNLGSLRLLRLLRLTRMARIMRFFPELMTLVKGMIRAMQSVFFIILFLVGVTWVFAIIFTSTLAVPNYQPPPGTEDPTAPMLFSDIPSSMMTLFTNGVLGDNLAQTLTTVRQDSLLLMWAFIAFMVMSGMTLLNMLIGVLCQVIDDSSREEEESRQLNDLRICLIDAFEHTDESQDGLITEEEWMNISSNPRVQASFMKLGVEESMMEERLAQMQESLFHRKKLPGEGEEDDVPDKDAKKGLTFDEFVDQVIDLRMDTPASALDVEMLKSAVRTEDRLLAKKMDRIEGELQKILGLEGLRTSPSISAAPAPAEDFTKDTKDSKDVLMSLPGQLMSDEANATATSTGSSENWLQDVPTELLFHILKSRAGQEAFVVA
mmetsp:Transcript_27104/g.48997  ORF Transcript_27104/g.48997 Transcript_27104/m.48997 type:complete len:544 (+) Transcript_27104:83-1714(+)